MIIDLQTGTFVALPGLKSPRGTLVNPRLLRDDLLVYCVIQKRDEYEVFMGLSVHGLEGDERRFIKCDVGRNYAASGELRFAYESEGVDTVELVELRHPYSVRTVEPMPKRVIQSVAFDSTTNRLLTSGWGELVLSFVGDDGLESVRRKSFGSADVHWTAIRGDTLVARQDDRLVVHDVGLGPRIGEERMQISGMKDAELLKLSSDGRALAAAFGRTLRLFDLQDGTVVELAGHSDDISFMTFSPGDERLITGDEDGRVRVWPLKNAETLLERPVVSRRARPKIEPPSEPNPPEPTPAAPADKPVWTRPPAAKPTHRPGPVPRAAKLIALKPKRDLDDSD